MIKNRFMLSAVVICLGVLFACDTYNIDREVERSLKLSKENREELESVLEHYSGDVGDSLKLRAAKFLIANMKYHYSATGEVVEEFNRFIDSAYIVKREAYHNDIYDEFKRNSKYYGQKPIYVSDLESIDADYLIDNIESAFEAWDRECAQHLTFEQFAELLLPYRIGNEEVERWRTIYSERFGALLGDSIGNTLEACRVINDSLIGYHIHTLETSINPSDIRASSLINIDFGLCNDYASLAVYAMRALGIPVAKDLIVRFGTRPNTHTFNMVLDGDGKIHDFSGAENQPDEHLSRFESIPKIYRKCFAPQRESLPFHAKEEQMPPQLASPFLKDVSAEYDILNASDIKVDFDYQGCEIAYLAVFDIKGWYPVGWAKPEDGSVTFKSVGSEVVYSAGYFRDRVFHAVGYPFVVKGGGVVEYLKPKSKISMTVERKYPIATGLMAIPNTIVGGEFQGANRRDFADAVTLHRISEAPQFEYITVDLESPRRFNYYRYMTPDSSRVNMAEIEFYSGGEVVKEEIIGEIDRSPYSPNSKIEDAFDGDPLTYVFSSSFNKWIGMMYDKPIEINKLRFLIRNGDNGIRKDQDYEIFYADNGKWISAGHKPAEQDNFITFEDVPSNALNWLRNHTKGKEERPFLYLNKEQIWY